MKLFSSKRGNFQETILGPMFPLLIAFGVFLLLLNYTGAVGKSSYFEREYMTRDIGLMVEALQASPNEVTLDYPDRNTEKSKELIITINKNFVEAHSYDVDEKLAPSKSSRYNLVQSKLDVNELVAKPREEKQANGDVFTFAYTLYFLKTNTAIIHSMNEKNIPTKIEKDYCAIISTIKENWFQTPKVYVHTAYSTNSAADKLTKDNIKGKDFEKGLCTYLTTRNGKGNGVYSPSDCKVNTPIDEQELAKADFVLLIFVNDKLQNGKINVYRIDGSGDIYSKSSKLACLTKGNLELNYEGSVNQESISAELLSYVKSISPNILGKPTMIVEINNIEELENNDITTIGGSIYSSLNDYYSG